MADQAKLEELKNNILDDTKQYTDKIDAVVSTWKYFYDKANDEELPEVLHTVITPLFRAAVRVILHGDWPRLKHITRRKLTSLIKKCNQYLYRKFPESAKKCKTLTFLWFDPWDHPTLRQILEKATAPDEDVCSWMNYEGNELLFLRLEAMCEGKCEDLALRLAACYLKHLNQNKDCHDVDVDDMTDIFIALLYKFNKKQEVTDMLTAMPINDGLKTIVRFTEKSKYKGRLWSHFDKMKHVAVNTLMDVTMDTCMDNEEDQLSMHNLIEKWLNLNIEPKLNLNEPQKSVADAVRLLISTAGSARHIYIFSQVINKKYGDRLKVLCIELYIRGLAMNLNEIEDLKIRCDEKLVQANKDLADGFLQLAELFSGNESVCRECILSSFALNPTKETLQRIQTLLQVEKHSAKPSTETSLDARRLKKCSYHYQYNCTCTNNFLSIQLEPELLKSAPHLPDDLTTVLSRSRPKDLTWALGMNLDKECQKYMKNFKVPEFKSPELQYLNIDYSQFKDRPLDEDEPSKSSSTMEGPSSSKPPKRRKSSSKIDTPKTRNKVFESSRKIRRKTSSALIVTDTVPKPVDSQPSTSDKGSYDQEHGQNSSFQTGNLSGNNTVNNQQSSPCKRESSTQTQLTHFETVNSVRYVEPFLQSTPHENGKALSSEKIKLDTKRLRLDHTSQTGSSGNCTTPISASERSKSVRTYFNRKTSNQSKDTCNSNVSYHGNHSPKPAEVPPTASSDLRIQEQLKPILKSLDMNPKVTLEEVTVNRGATQLPRGTTDKHGFPSSHDNSRDILAQAVMRSDILLAKSVPGMNSFDMIVPQPQETAVNVVQISNSMPHLSQPVVTTVVASSSISHSIHSSNTSAGANTLQVSNSTSMSRIKNTDNNFQTDCPSSSQVNDLSKIHDANSYASASSGEHTSPTLLIPTSSTETRMNTIQLHASNPQLATSIPYTPQQEGTLVTAHIQRVGQPSRPRNSAEMGLRGTNSMSQASSSNDDGNKVSSSHVFRLVVKDGRVIEQYYQGNQSLEPVLSIPDSEDVERSPNAPNTYNHDHFIQLLKKKNDAKAKPAPKPGEHFQVSSLPKFHQVFGRQIYQSDSMSLESSSMSSHAQYEERSSSAEVKSQSDVSSSGLSKGVQTANLKDPELPNKTSEKPKTDVQTNLSNSAVLQTSSTGISQDVKEVRPTDIPSSSGVIFACKVPISLSNSSMLQGKPVTILKTTSTSVDTIQCSEVIDNESRSKDTVIRSGNMNALLAAALKNASPIKHTVINNPTSSQLSMGNVKHIKVNNAESIVMQKIRMPTPVQKNVRRQAAQPTRYIRPMIQVSTGNSMTQTGPPVVTIPLPSRTVVLAANVNHNTLQSSLAKIETRQDHLGGTGDQASVSSTTLEQLREFESVLEQVTNTSQMKERGNAKKVEHQPTQTTSSDFSVVAASKVNPIFQSSLVSSISDLNNERVSLTFINKNVSSGSNPLITSSPTKIATSTPVVVVQSCSRPLASPALSITSQSSLSPAPQTSPAHIPSKIGPKVNKPKLKSSVGKTAPTATIKVSTLPKPQQKPQEDEQTTQRIFAILDKYAEQLMNSPELKNKPAPRRRSNPPTNPTQSSKRKKSSHNKSKSVSSLPTCSSSEMSPGSEDLRTLGSEDSSNGVSQLSQVLNSPQSRNDEHSNPPGGDVSSETSESLDAKDQRSQHRILLTEPSSSSGRTVLVQENIQPLINVEGPKVLAGKQLVVGSGATVPLTLSLPAGNVKQVIFPVPADGRPFVVAKVPKMYRVHQVTMPTGSPLLATTAGSGAVVLRQMCLNKANTGVKQVKLPMVSQLPTQGMNNIGTQPTVMLPSGSQSFTLATGSSLDGESLGITLDNTILLNPSTSQPLGFYQRNVTKSVGSQQSPNLLVPSTRASLETDSQFLSTTEMSSQVKCEGSPQNHMIRTVTTDDQNKTSNSSSHNSSGLKNEELLFDGCTEVVNDKQQTSSTELITQNPKPWARLQDISKENKDTQEQNSIQLDMKTKKPEFTNIARDGCLSNAVQAKPEEQELKTCSQNDSVIKSKVKNESEFDGDRNPTLHMNVKPIQCLAVPHSSSSNQWQYNLSKTPDKSTKDAKTELSTHEQAKTSSSGILLNNVNHAIGVKRKLNAENTIFQVAFKRTKLVKDEFMQQRNSSSCSTLEREIRLQKSLSEECEDLGVDKPRTSELFPEADLLLDSDPLSRDSLQELYSRGVESSSSSRDSPTHTSPPIILSETTSTSPHAKFTSVLWKKQKSTSKTKSTDSSSSDKMLMKLERLDAKSDSSCGSNSPLNGSSEPSHRITRDVKSLGNENLEFNEENPTSVVKKEDVSVPSSSRDDIHSLESDNCRFSEADDSCIDADLMDTDGESDSDTQSRDEKRDATAAVDFDDDDDDKTNDFQDSPENTCKNCTYQGEDNKEEEEKNYSNLQWFDMDQDGEKGGSSEHSAANEDSTVCSPNKGNARSKIKKTAAQSSRLATGNDNTPLNGMLLDESWSSSSVSIGCHRHEPSEKTMKPTKSSCSTTTASTVSSFYREMSSPRHKRNRKLSTSTATTASVYVSSGGEDSGSSIDIDLSGGSDDLQLKNLSRRASVRGRVKKGCPCLNGSPDHDDHDTRKKKDLSQPCTFVKTENKPCVTAKSVNFPAVTPSKKSQKVTMKNPNKRR